MGAFDAWLGREQLARDQLNAAQAARWLATFDLPAPPGRRMPQGIHWCLCLPDEPTGQLGQDGHPVRHGGTGSFLPPFAQPRRMWAGSALEFYAPIDIGSPVERRSRISTIEEKQGRSGTLAFVTILHEWTSARRAVLTERQTLVFRDAAPPESTSGRAVHPASFRPAQWDCAQRLVPSTMLLQRYSALTFNSHRIHYDADYCRNVEAYPGPVVHGPLIASLLLQLAARQLGHTNALTRFSFRAQAPAFAGEELVLALRRIAPGRLALAAFGDDGSQRLEASAAYSAG